jgi:osmotically-inducible protein OsmY
MEDCLRNVLILFAISAVAMSTPAQTSNSKSLSQSDSVLSTVNGDFARDPGLRDVKITISDGYVHLRGTVEVLEDARQAIKKVNQSGTSNGVISHIVVRAPTVPDAFLRLQVEEKLHQLQLDSLRIRVRRGVVRISGTIPEERQHEDVLSMICSIRGVKGIDDLVNVTSAARAPGGAGSPTTQ